MKLVNLILLLCNVALFLGMAVGAVRGESFGLTIVCFWYLVLFLNFLYLWHFDVDKSYNAYHLFKKGSFAVRLVVVAIILQLLVYSCPLIPGVSHYRNALFFKANGQYSQAINQYKMEIESWYMNFLPNNNKNMSIYDLAKLYARTGDFENAIKYLEQLHQIDPGYLTYGDCSALKNDLEKSAQNELELYEAIDLALNFNLNWGNKAKALEVLNKVNREKLSSAELEELDREIEELVNN